MLTTASNQSLVLRCYKAFDDRTIDRALDLLAPNFVAYLAGMPDLLGCLFAWA